MPGITVRTAGSLLRCLGFLTVIGLGGRVSAQVCHGVPQAFNDDLYAIEKQRLIELVWSIYDRPLESGELIEHERLQRIDSVFASDFYAIMDTVDINGMYDLLPRRDTRDFRCIFAAVEVWSRAPSDLWRRSRLWQSLEDDEFFRSETERYFRLRPQEILDPEAEIAAKEFAIGQGWGVDFYGDLMFFEPPRRTQRTFEKSLAFVVRNVLRQMGPTEIARLLAIADNATPEKREILLDLVCRHEASLVDRDN